MILTWKFKQIRFKEQKKLNKSNLYLYKCITSYIRHSDLRETEKEEALQQIIDMFLQAQLEKRPMELIIGDDYHKFCESIIDEYSSDKDKNYRVLNYIQRGLLWTIISSVSLAIVGGIIKSSFNLGITVDTLILASIISFVSNQVTRKNGMEDTSLAFWYRTLYVMKLGINNSRSIGFYLPIATYALIRFVLDRALSPKVFSYTITLYSSIPYMLLIIVIIASIEIYKKIYNKDR